MWMLRDSIPAERVFISGSIILGICVPLMLLFTIDSVLIGMVSLVFLAVLIILVLFMLCCDKRWFILGISWFNKRILPVELIDMDLVRYYTLAHVDTDGNLVSPVYWGTGTGKCMLLPNGTVDRRSPSGYVYFWLPLRQQDRVEHVLKNDLPDFNGLTHVGYEERSKIMKEARTQANAIR